MYTLTLQKDNSAAKSDLNNPLRPKFDSRPWALTSIMLPKAPDAELLKDPNPLIEAFSNYQLIHLEGRIDSDLQNEVAFKLTPDSIEALIKYNKDIHCVNIAATTYNWPEKELQVKRIHAEFIQVINEFVYKTDPSALERPEGDDAGELQCGKSEEVKNNIMGLFLPLFPLHHPIMNELDIEGKGVREEVLYCTIDLARILYPLLLISMIGRFW
jgi:hypothetical protein